MLPAVLTAVAASGPKGLARRLVETRVRFKRLTDAEIEDYVGTSRVLGFTMLVAAIDVVLITAAATLLAFLYNMSAALLGGVEITLAEDN